MEQLCETQIKEKLKSAFWDTTATDEELFEVLQGKREAIHSINKLTIFSRLLNTYDWYVLLKIIPFKELPLALSSEVLEKLWPQNLQKRYLNARRILFE